MVVTAFNARSFKNKLAAFQHALNKRKVDVCVANELSAAVPQQSRDIPGNWQRMTGHLEGRLSTYTQKGQT